MEEQKIIIRTTAYVYNKKLAMAFTCHGCAEVNVEQFDLSILRDVCYDARDKLNSMDVGNVEVERVSACAVIIVNGITFTSKRVAIKFA